MEELGYDNRPRNWYGVSPETASLDPDNEMEEVLKLLTPSEDLDIFRSHPVRATTESGMPDQVMKQRIGEDSFYMETYSRPVDDLSTRELSLDDLRDMEFRVEVVQGNGSAGAHRSDTVSYDGLPDEVREIFKDHDDYSWEPAGS